jgi:hypothetical protein
VRTPNIRTCPLLQNRNWPFGGLTWSPRLSGWLAIVALVWVAYPANAQSGSFLGQRATDVRFADRLHGNASWQIGLGWPGFESPLFDDSSTGPFVAAGDRVVAGEVIPQDAPSEFQAFDLEAEIVRAVGEIFHLEHCEAFARVWSPIDRSSPQRSNETSPLRAAQVVRLANGVYVRSQDWAVGLSDRCQNLWRRGEAWVSTVAAIEIDYVAAQPQPVDEAIVEPAPSSVPRLEPSLFWEVLSADLSRQATELGRELVSQFARVEQIAKNGALSPAAWQWLGTRSEHVIDLAATTWQRLAPQSRPESIEPVPTASYIGLERAIYQVHDLLRIHVRRWQSRAAMVTAAAVRFEKLQNEAYERVVLRQFDAILR